MGKSSGVALARLGRSLGARSTRNTGKWCLVSALRVRRHSALVALVARLPKLDPLLAGSTTLSVEIVLGRKPALKNRRKKWIEHAGAKTSSTLEARNMAATPTSCSLDLVTERPSTARNRSTIEMVLNRVSCNTRHEDSSRQVSLRD
jgi:hypothetical protein